VGVPDSTCILTVGLLEAVSLVEILKFLRRKLLVRLALLQMLCICWRQYRWLFKVQPRYLMKRVLVYGHEEFSCGR